MSLLVLLPLFCFYGIWDFLGGVSPPGKIALSISVLRKKNLSAANP
jgi:hypothetical protein